MDPLSITASIIALVQASAAVGKGVKILLSLRHAPADFSELVDELTTLQAVIEQVKSPLQKIETGDVAIPTLNIAPTLALKQSLEIIQEELLDLCYRLTGTNHGDEMSGQLRVSMSKWIRERSNIAKLKYRATNTRASLMLCLSALVSSQRYVQADRQRRALFSGLLTTDSSHQARVMLEIRQLIENSFRALHEERRINREMQFINQAGIEDIKASLGQMYVKALKSEDSLQRRDQSSNVASNGPRCVETGGSPFLWLLLRALFVATSRNTLTGAGSSIYLRIPRLVPRDHLTSIVYNCDIDYVKRGIFNSTVLPTDVDEDGNSLLMLSLRDVNLTLSEFLIEQGWPLHAENVTGCLDSYGWCPLHWAIFLADYASFDMLLYRGASLKTTTRSGWTPLHYAARYEPLGSVRMTRALLEAGADVDAQVNNYRGSRGETAIMFAFDNPGVVELLLQKGSALVVETDTNWVCPLSYRARRTSNVARWDPRRCYWDRSLDLLCNAGMDLNVPSKQAGFEGRTPIHDTILWRNAALLELLIQCGARLDAIDKNGSGVLHFAAQSANQELIDVLSDARIRGVNPDQANAAGDTPMRIMTARLYGKEDSRQPGETVPTFDEWLAFRHFLEDLRERNREDFLLGSKRMKTPRTRERGFLFVDDTSSVGISSSSSDDVD
ncbi:hypothetical protein CORC01_08986 [Colletotrichum orchidophilum]|uniref:Uncharacterized protein n=1 Tax=Colletotrichum orchidophilum TaxID=1209926 RepID=A0A1G4B331_9PEZI|nr:uncharacterized protein CORC01_08986 [Colletotrichum orchidophilum]OHE95702.1 hypothetical protein CORC01_08986 [Colletotrichum orchidophilum]